MRASPHWEMSRVQFLCRKGLESHDRTKDGFNIGSINICVDTFQSYHWIQNIGLDVSTPWCLILLVDVVFFRSSRYFPIFFMFWPETPTQISSSDGFPPKTPIQHVSDGECPKIFSRSLRLLLAPHKKSTQKKKIWFGHFCSVSPFLLRFPLLETTTISKFPILDLLFRGHKNKQLFNNFHSQIVDAPRRNSETIWIWSYHWVSQGPKN